MLKCEGFNFAGSIKLKAAREMVEAAERSGRLRPGGSIVESSSGNLGIVLSPIAASLGCRFVCVTDVRCTLGARQLMRVLGTEVHVITEPHPEEDCSVPGYAMFVRCVHARKSTVWLNQHSNAANWGAHYRLTGPELLRDFPDLTWTRSKPSNASLRSPFLLITVEVCDADRCD